jgi:nucleoside-diphosphate-sugar epimerase
MTTAGLGRVLVTGASGFVGRHALAPLLAQGYRVDAVARRTPAAPLAGVAWHEADLLDASARRGLIDALRPSHLLHTAWNVEPGRFWTAPENETWREASLDLLAAFAAAGGRRAVLVGTCAEYDWDRAALGPYRETDPCRPSTPYGKAKHALAQGAAGLARRTGLSLAWARLFLLFGPGEDPRRIVAAVIRALLLGHEIALSSGRQVRDFMDTRDVAAALAALVAAEPVTGAINLASGRAISLREMCMILARLAGRSPTLLRFGALPDRAGEPAQLLADVSRLRDELGFAQSVPLETRLAECLAWHRSALADTPVSNASRSSPD